MTNERRRAPRPGDGDSPHVRKVRGRSGRCDWNGGGPAGGPDGTQASAARERRCRRAQRARGREAGCSAGGTLGSDAAESLPYIMPARCGACVDRSRRRWHVSAIVSHSVRGLRRQSRVGSDDTSRAPSDRSEFLKMVRPLTGCDVERGSSDRAFNGALQVPISLLIAEMRFAFDGAPWPLLSFSEEFDELCSC